MSFQAAIASLPPPVKDLVLKVTNDGAELVGETEADQTSVNGWIEKAQGEASKLKELNETLTPKTYVATNYFTAADVALFGAIYPVVAGLQTQEYYALPSVTRYFDHIQSRLAVRSAADALQQFPAVTLHLENAPAVERKAAEPKQKKEKAPKQAAPDTVTPTADMGKKAEAAPAAVEGEKVQKKEKKEKQKKGENKEEGSSKPKKEKRPAAPAADEGEPKPSMIDLRVGHIVDIMKHPDADGLYVEQIDVGEETPRTVVSGLVNYIPIEDMRDKMLITVCNLKPANMRGVKSFAMVLCATSKEGREGGIELIQPPEGAKPGDRVYFEGDDYEGATPLPQLNPKKKIFEAIQPGFITLDSKEAAWVNPATQSIHKIRTKDGVCYSPTLVGASLS